MAEYKGAEGIKSELLLEHRNMMMRLRAREEEYKKYDIDCDQFD